MGAVLEGQTCLVVAGMQHKGVGKGSNGSTGEVEHCCSHPVDAPLHWHLQAQHEKPFKHTLHHWKGLQRAEAYIVSGGRASR